MMRKTVLPLTLIGGCLLAGGPATADDIYFGTKVGSVMIDGPDPTNASVMLGFELGVLAGDLGVEAELGTTIDEAGDGGEVDTAAAYLAFRSAGPIYLIGKGGTAWRDETGTRNRGTETSASFGLGVGFSLGVAQLEAEFTRLDNDADYLTLGLRF